MYYDAIIIGAGMAGLTSAIKLTSEGKKVIVLEKQPVPGGVATSFKRKGFKFESSLHFVDALAPGEEVRDFLDEQGVSRKVEYLELKEFGRVIYPEHDFTVGNDFEALKARLKKDFPHETKGIEAVFSDIARFSGDFDRFMDSKFPLWLKLMLSPIFYSSIIITSCLTAEQLIAKRIKDKKLAAILGTIWGFMGLPPKELSAFYFLIVLRGCWGRKTAYIKGGFNRLFEAIVDKIRERGSEVRFNTRVTQITTDNGERVKGVITENGEEIRGRAVISNANCIDTLSKLIDSPVLRDYYAGKLGPMQKSVSAFTIYLGLDVPAKALGMENSLLSINPTYDHSENYNNSLSSNYGLVSLAVVDHSQLDSGLAPQGKSTICIMTLDNYANWSGLSAQDYEQKKKEACDAILTQLETYLPGITKHIEVMEAATPKTMARYATLPEGAVYGLAQTVEQSGVNRLSQNTRVKGLFICGAWTQPGCGIHGCFVSGIDAADMALKQLKK
ncbi:MAG: NAD(P)/FAD-dependent oxidoreductase [Candidatus Omnitrophica bacterium]|nr:NAD(P)/FAD-dependent oxidoreductase [Candidatus Omnitrophota bacterium]